MTDNIKNNQNMVSKEPPQVSIKREPFKIFPTTEYIGNICCTAMDTGKPTIHSDQQAQDACCAECSCICFPLTIIYDILSCPCRGIYYCYNK